MTKKKKHINNIDARNEQEQSNTDFGRGMIKDNALKAVVTSKLFTTRVVATKKGKGSYQRKAKYKGRESYSIAA